jgi:uncharacterized protein (TIGR00297 family)
LDTASLLAGLILALAASYLALRTGMLKASGAVASTVLGTIVFGAGSWQWAVLLLVFFFTSSALGRAYKPRKLRYGEDYAKGDRRDAGQVAANGAVAAAFVALHVVFPGAGWTWIGFAASLAAANADTWATELGVLSGSRPRLVTNPNRQVETGTSGGISVAGTLAAVGGSVLIAASAGVLDPAVGWLALAAIAVGGILGAAVDSVLGATIQAIYFCPVDQRETEKHPLHGCGSPTTLVRGWSWLNNDWVNAACTATGAITACLLSAALAAF